MPHSRALTRIPLVLPLQSGKQVACVCFSVCLRYCGCRRNAWSPYCFVRLWRQHVSHHKPQSPHTSCERKNRRGSTLRLSLWSVRSENSNQLPAHCASVWEHFHTAFTLMGNWNWLSRRTWPSWGLEQSACVSKQTHKFHSSELWVRACTVWERGCKISASLKRLWDLVKHSGNTMLAICLRPPSRRTAFCCSSQGPVMDVQFPYRAISWHSLLSLFLLLRLTYTTENIQSLYPSLCCFIMS